MALTLASRLAQFAASLLGAGGDAANFRASVGQKWITIHDTIVSGAAVSQIDVDLLGYTNLRFRFDWLFNAAIADGGLAIRNSLDGGATYRSGGSDYYYALLYMDAATSAAAATLASTGTLTNTFDDASASVPILVDGSLHAGSASRRSTARAQFYGDGPAGPRLGQGHTRAQVTGKSTHIRFMSDIGVNSFDIGTRLIVEAAP